jgi:CheY-like chemotaxis protein
MSAQRSILVVDDDEQLLRLIVRLLEGAGHRTRAASNLPVALALFDSSSPQIDLALLDVNLAGASSGGAAELLPLLQDRVPGLEVVLMSGDALPESLERELAARGGRFLRKPFAPKTLIGLIAGSQGSPSTVGAGRSSGVVG